MTQRKTQEKFVDDVSKTNGDNIKVIGQYINTNSKIKIECVKCHLQTDVLAMNLVKRKWYCPVCYPKRSTHTVVLENSIYTQAPWMIEWMKNPEDAKRLRPNSCKEKIIFRCKNCGAEREDTPNHIYTRGFVCKACDCGHSHNYGMTLDQIQRRVDLLSNSKFDVLQYQNQSHGNQVILRCRNCGHIFKRASKFLSINGKERYCPNCEKGSAFQKYNKTEWEKRISDNIDKKFTLLKIDGFTKESDVWLSCNKCGAKFTLKVGGIVYKKRKHYCPNSSCENCRPSPQKITTKDFQNKLEIIPQFASKEYVMAGGASYIDSKSSIKILHTVCGNTFYRNPSGLLHTHKICCPYCNAKYVSGTSGNVAQNMIAESAPWMIPYLKNKSDAFQYRPNSSKEIEIRCPQCGYVTKRTPNSIYKKDGVRFSCPVCSDGRSYQNKFLISLLCMRKENISDLHAEYTIKDYKYRYDAYFKIKGTKYLVELDGGIGHGRRCFGRYTQELSVSIDQQKEIIARENDYELIRIDCYYKKMSQRQQVVIDAIKNSKLQDIFNFTDKEYFMADEKGNKSILVEITNLIKETTLTYEEIANKLGVSVGCIHQYVRQAKHKGLLPNCRIVRKNRKGIGQPILCLETGYVYPSIKAANKMTHASVHEYLNGRCRHAGTLPDGTPLTWRKITDEEYNECKLHHPELIIKEAS